MFRREFDQKIQEFPCVQNVIIQKSFHGIDIFFAPDMFMSGEIGNNMKSAFCTEDFFEHGVRKTQRICTIVFGNKHTISGTQIARQFCQTVFVGIDDDQLGRFEWE